MKFRVIDFETSDSDKALKEGRPSGIVEWGYTDIESGGDEPIIGATYSGLTDPGHSISIEAMSVHHIQPWMLEGKPSPSHATRKLMDGMEPGDVFCAHNIEFEQAFFGGGEHEWICTYKCSRHLYPDMGRHSNQYLRYALGVHAEYGFDEDMAAPPHRAGPDTYVTAHILKHMLKDNSVEHLVELTKTPVLLQTIPFGKHKGRKFSEVPGDYLSWVLDQDFDRDVKHTARHWLNENRRAVF